MLLRCSSQTEFFMRLFNVECSRRVRPVKRCRWNSITLYLCIVIKYFRFRTYLSKRVFVNRQACTCSVLNVCLCSFLPAKVHPSNRAGFSFPGCSRQRLDTRQQASKQLCVCVFVTVSLALCVFVSVYIFHVWKNRGAKEEENKFESFWHGARKNSYKSRHALK